MAERARGSVRLYTRKGNDFADRFPVAASAIRKLPVRSCIDGEAIVCDANGLAVFDLLRRWGGNDVVLCAFDLLELDGKDLRRLPIEERKSDPRKTAAPAGRRHCLQRVLQPRRWGHLQVCLRARLRGHRIKAPRFDVSVRSRGQLAESQKPAAPAVTREAEEVELKR
jgi:ATP-dependent DNA ligase